MTTVAEEQSPLIDSPKAESSQPRAEQPSTTPSMEGAQPAWKGLALVFLPSLVLFVIMDVIFIGLVAGPMFEKALAGIIRPQPDVVAGLLAWTCICGLVYTNALPRSRSPKEAFLNGAWVGLCLYGTYELTNYSVIETWSYAIVATDMAWGSFACGAACLTMHALQNCIAGAAQPGGGRDSTRGRP